MTNDIVTRIRTVFEDTPEVLSTLDVETYSGAEAHTHMLGMWETMKEAADYIEKLERKRSIISVPPPNMTDSRGRVWKRNEDGYFCLVSRDEYRKIFLLRRKKLTYKAIGSIYQIHYGSARMLFLNYMRIRRAKVREYLELRNTRGKQ
jgi:hypothetical protein